MSFDCASAAPRVLGGTMTARMRGILVMGIALAMGWSSAPCIAQTSAPAQSRASISIEDLRDPGRAAEWVSDAQQSSYKRVLAAYAGETSAHPADATLALAQCRFIRPYAFSEEIAWSDDALADLDACREAIGARFKQDAEVILYVFESVWGEEAIKAIRAVQPASEQWTKAQQSRLHAQLSNAYSTTKQKTLAGQEAVISARLDANSSVFNDGLRYLCDTQRRKEAETLLASSPLPDESWRLSARLHFASDNLSPAAALAELERAKGRKGISDTWLAAHVYERAGKYAEAAETLARIDTKSDYQGPDQYKLRADIAAGIGDHLAEATAVKEWLAKSGITAPVLFAYGSLLAHAPSQGFSLPLLPLALTLLLTALMLVVAPAFLAFPAHYRGTVRMRRHLPLDPPFARIGLRHMWLGLATLLLTSGLVPVLGAGNAVQAIGAGHVPTSTEASSFAMVELMTLALGALLVLPVILKLSFREWIGSRQFKFAAVVIVAFMVIKLLAYGLLAHSGAGHQAIKPNQHDQLVSTMAAGAVSMGGASLALILVAVLAPIYEELIFRGLILGGLARHLSFGWSNAWQALIFATIHFDLRNFVFYLAFGLVAGWLVRRTRGLAASMLLHVINNGIATLALLSASSAG